MPDPGIEREWMMIDLQAPTLELMSTDGARAIIQRYGAHVTSWIPAGGAEQLFLSRLAKLDGSAPIRGGVPVIFPQFAGEGPLPKHGFARSQIWRAMDCYHTAHGVAQARLVLDDNAATRALWPQAFSAELVVSVGGDALKIELHVRNRDRSPIRFTAALHGYFAVDDIADVRVHGTGGLEYRDSANGNAVGRQDDAALAIEGEVDRIYFDTPPTITLCAGQRRLESTASGFTDTVIWNPGAAKAAALADLEPDSYRRMLCIEPAVIGKPVTLNAGQHWIGMQTLHCRDAQP